MEKSDAELIWRAQKGDKKAFELLITRYYQAIFGWIYLRLENYAATEDITQEVFLRAWRSLKKLTEPRGFTTWLFQIAQNCFQEWSRQYRKLKLVSFAQQFEITSDKREDNPLQTQIDKEQLENLKNKLKKMPESYYLVLSLKYQKGMSCRQIAELIDQPIGTVTSTLSRAYQWLRKELKEKQDEFN